MPAATNPHAPAILTLKRRPVIPIKRMAITAAASCRLVETTRRTRATNIVPPTRQCSVSLIVSKKGRKGKGGRGDGATGRRGDGSGSRRRWTRERGDAEIPVSVPACPPRPFLPFSLPCPRVPVSPCPRVPRLRVSASPRLPVSPAPLAYSQRRKPPRKAFSFLPKRACGGSSLSNRLLPPPRTT